MAHEHRYEALGSVKVMHFVDSEYELENRVTDSKTDWLYSSSGAV